MTILTFISAFALRPKPNRSTLRTFKTIWLSQGSQLINAVLLCFKHFFKVHLIYWIFHPVKLKLYGRRSDTPFFDNNEEEFGLRSMVSDLAIKYPLIGNEVSIYVKKNNHG